MVTFVCPYHRWTYALDGDLIGAPRMEDAIAIKALREESALPHLKTEIWHGFIFVNFDDAAAALAPTLRKLEPYLVGYDLDAMVTIPAKRDPSVPWNWKMLLENYIEPYHTDYVHPVIHDFAPSSGVEFDPRRGDDDNAIVRYVPFLEPDGGLTERGWATPASFPPIETLSPRQRHRVGFGMVPPSMNIIFTPDMLCYGFIYPNGPTSLSVAGGLFTHGGWCLPKASAALPDFHDRAARLMEGSRQLGEQDTAINLSMQRSKYSRFAPRGTAGAAGGNAQRIQPVAGAALPGRSGAPRACVDMTARGRSPGQLPAREALPDAAGLVSRCPAAAAIARRLPIPGCSRPKRGGTSRRRYAA